MRSDDASLNNRARTETNCEDNSALKLAFSSMLLIANNNVVFTKTSQLPFVVIFVKIVSKVYKQEMSLTKTTRESIDVIDRSI